MPPTKKPAWLQSEANTPAEAPAAEPTTSTYYVTSKSGSPDVASMGRVPRTNAHMLNVPLPKPLHDRVQSLLRGGSVSQCVVGLVAFALDEIEKQGLSLTTTTK